MNIALTNMCYFKLNFTFIEIRKKYFIFGLFEAKTLSIIMDETIRIDDINNDNQLITMDNKKSKYYLRNELNENGKIYF